MSVLHHAVCICHDDRESIKISVQTKMRLTETGANLQHQSNHCIMEHVSLILHPLRSPGSLCLRINSGVIGCNWLKSPLLLSLNRVIWLHWGLLWQQNKWRWYWLVNLRRVLCTRYCVWSREHWKSLLLCFKINCDYKEINCSDIQQRLAETLEND